MNVLLVLNLTGVVLLFTALFMLAPAVVSLLYGSSDLKAILLSFALTAGAGGILFLLTRKHRNEEIGHRDGFFAVALSWSVMALAGALPFLLSGAIPSVTDAVFESMSGFTTTGSSILTNVEALSRGVLFWRSLTHWIGGLGIIVFFVAVLPMMGAGGSQLFRAEVSQVVPQKLKPRIIDAAKSLWIIYIAFTALGVLLLRLGGMDLYDSFCHTFGAIGTGGFSTKNLSIGAYTSSYIHYVIIVLMFVGGTSFTLHYQALAGGLRRYVKNGEFVFYAMVLAACTALIVLATYRTYYDSLAVSFRDALFQVVSITTATGYVTVDYEKWPVFTQALLLMAMFIGGMAGSTAGGMKQARVLLMVKHMYREIYQLIHPRAVTSIKLDGRTIQKEVLGSVWGFIFLFLSIWVLASLAMTALGVDMVTASSTAVAAMSNVGPALGQAGPAENFASLPVAAKWVLTFCMLVGRLEVYTVMILFVPRYWRK
ncbi:MAG: TrkH family potassium uptake protein [Nitrospirota bacterium]